MRLFRFWLGRHLIHAGLHILPKGRARAELYYLLNNWGRHVVDTVQAARRDRSAI